VLRGAFGSLRGLQAGILCPFVPCLSVRGQGGWKWLGAQSLDNPAKGGTNEVLPSKGGIQQLRGADGG
jgi:hypothetical protein